MTGGEIVSSAAVRVSEAAARPVCGSVSLCVTDSGAVESAADDAECAPSSVAGGCSVSVPEPLSSDMLPVCGGSVSGEGAVISAASFVPVSGGSTCQTDDLRQAVRQSIKMSARQKTAPGYGVCTGFFGNTARKEDF